MFTGGRVVIVVQNIVTPDPLSYVGQGCTNRPMTITVELTLGETLRLMRERAGYSQAQLAGYLEIGRTSVIRYEADTALPKWKDAQTWARICDHDPMLLRDAWHSAVESGCIYGQLGLFDFIARTDGAKFN